MHTADSVQSPFNLQTIQQAMLALASRTDLTPEAKRRGIASLQSALNRMQAQTGTLSSPMR